MVTRILVVDDDDVDRERLVRALESRPHSRSCDLVESPSGISALETLRSEPSASSDIRDVILLDLNMPGMTGHEFLDELRSSSSLKRSIVFVLTSSDHPQDRARAYGAHVAGYFLKSRLPEVADAIDKYVASVRYPPRS